MKLILILLFVASMPKAALLNFTMQYSFANKDHSPVYSLGACRMSSSGTYYLEGGFVGLPSFSNPTTHVVPNFTDEKKYTESLYGFYAGYHLYLFPIFRPGVLLGSSLKNENIYRKSATSEMILAEHKEAEISPYFGLSIQAGIFSFVYSNYGIGGGFNFSI